MSADALWAEIIALIPPGWLLFLSASLDQRGAGVVAKAYDPFRVAETQIVGRGATPTEALGNLRTLLS